MRQQLLIVALLFTVMGNARSCGSDDKPSAVPVTWQEDARKRGLSDAEIASLEKNDLLLTNQEYRQVYSAYSHPDIPVFITSDSLLNAYHVLLEESVVQREILQVSRLSETLKLILKDLETLRFTVRDQPELNAAAQRRARLVVGIAARLLDKSFRLGDAELDEILDEESARIETAEEEFLPEWLGTTSPPFFAIHYSRFKPRSFYTRNVQLERYFRAVSWLQAIPFRIEQDEELLAMLMLGHALRDRPPKPDEEARDINVDDAAWDASENFRGTFRYFYELVGNPDLPDLLKAADEARRLSRAKPEMTEEELSEKDAHEKLHSGKEITETELSQVLKDGEAPSSAGGGGFFGDGRGGESGLEPQEKVLLLEDLQQCRKSLQMQIKDSGTEPQINDQDRLPPDDPRQVDDPQFRVISASRTPDAVLFTRTTDLRRFNRPFPGGLEVAIALGSTPARSFLSDPEKERVLQEIDSCKDLFRTENLYGAWLNTLMALFDEPEHDAPEFMRGDAWQRKSCNTVLASWAQLRHTYALHAKVSGGFGGGVFLDPPPGFVEPNPEFFSRMADLAEQTKWTLYADGDLQPLLPDYRPLVPMLESMRGLANGVADATAMSQKQDEQLLVDEILFGLACNVEELLVHQSDSEGNYGDRWKHAVEHHLSHAKIDLIRNLAEGVADGDAMEEKFEELNLSNDELLFGLVEGFRNLTSEYTESTRPWCDRWNQMCDRYLIQVVASLKHLADGITSAKAMEAKMSKRWDEDDAILREVLTYRVHQVTSVPMDSQMPYSELWDHTIDQLIQQVQDEASDKDPELTAIFDPGISDLREVWDDLVSTCRRLEAIAHKQLRGSDLNQSEKGFILGYGGNLETLMLRSGSDPRDDAPWAIGVYTNHQLRQTLHATTSRPRALYVLYPWHGTKVLSRGAVLPYREAISDSPLTDEEWRQQLDAGTAPPLPEWLQPILSPAP